jgi:alginate O-acetyltransferase complex protein AlgI
MLLGGIWHGANWTFVVWGLWHGGLMAIERAFGIKGKRKVLPTAIAWPVTMVLVLIGWVIFRAASISYAIAVYAGMLGLNGLEIRPEFLVQIQTTELLFLALGLAVVVPKPDFALPQFAPVVSHAFLLAVSITLMQARSGSPFLYFQF